MDINEKILSDIIDLEEYIKNIKYQKEKIVLCQGHFNVIHPGHLRFLEFAESHGDYLIVAVQGDSKIASINKGKFYSSQDRAKGVASLSYVDKVILYDDFSIEDIINIVKPYVYIMGEEFSDKKESVRSQIKAVEDNSGKIVFSSGDSQYNIAEFLEKNLSVIKNERMTLFRNAIDRQGITKEGILSACERCSDKHILVIGDTILDKYVACDALGMSSEAPVLVVKEVDNKEYVGGAAIVARHLKALGTKCTFLSLTGADNNSKKVEEVLISEGINYKLITDSDRPTTLKIRYMVGTQKLLRVSRLVDYYLTDKMSNEAISFIDKIKDRIDGIIVSDFGYGLITPMILEYLSDISSKYNIKLFGDSQSSSQTGDVLKFKNYFFIKPNEKEARLALNDKYNGLEFIGKKIMEKTVSDNIILTLAAEGFITFQKQDGMGFVKTQHFPALNPDPMDVVGAGDSMLTALACSICAGTDIMTASAVGAIVSSIAVSKVGNVPVTIDEVKEWINNL